MMFQAILGFLGGPLVNGLIAAYKAKLDAGNTADKIAADLAAKDIDLQVRERELATQINISQEGRWWTAAPRAIVTWAFAIFVVKVVVIDKVFKLGVTDPLSGDLQTAFMWLMALWFGGRSLEKIARIVKQ